MKISAKLKVSASKSATSPSCKTFLASASKLLLTKKLTKNRYRQIKNFGRYLTTFKKLSNIGLINKIL